MGEFEGTAKHLSAIELRLWTSFLDTSRILETELERQLVNSFDMTHREYEVLVRVDGGGGQMRLNALARQIEASPALITQTINRLVERGWVKRQPAADDRRGVEAALTAAGRRALGKAAGPHAERVRQLLICRMEGGDLAAIAASMEATADHLRSHRRGEGCDDASCPMD